ncbi:putative methylated DNA-protein cysteine methyltransferase [Bernardetia litoralis DSM 6794]|uniref:Putative methylated DNA-protein cysteine methyltransferase n=1 Tax=Bernardetia litoralis (strain ATCC 23117 / DSM 6794 / NBRC 15988 / NCIMB 1366 / Fx l1 / Sio-4) TaxID=880071 RepID=I4AM43_BERLS|nr:MGMT family protein [Bernardetia litoralis]AFM05028.1 putative methylated DNA-protein cysteine methyltransferase [Bernardetia litoralis DSM 6794]
MKTTFQQDVIDVVLQIPKGRVTSYGTIAKFLGHNRGARMVGWVMNNCHVINAERNTQNQKEIPAHRVVNRNGSLTGRFHFETPTTMQELLEAENIEIRDHQIQDFSNVFWNPQLELL